MDEKIMLCGREIDIRTTGGLSAHLFPFSENKDRDFRFSRGGHGIGQSITRILDPASLRMEEARTGREFLPDPIEQRDHIIRFACAVPGAERILPAVRKRSDYSDGFDRFPEWKDLALILQQDDGFVRGFQCECAVFRRQFRPALPFFADATERIVEKAECKFHP
jgi:hypothetical protein